jgi:hypothetical protein
LVTKSFATSKSSMDYLRKRVLRIYPEYVIAFLSRCSSSGPWPGDGSAQDLQSGLRILSDWRFSKLRASLARSPAATIRRSTMHLTTPRGDCASRR